MKLTSIYAFICAIVMLALSACTINDATQLQRDTNNTVDNTQARMANLRAAQDENMARMRYNQTSAVLTPAHAQSQPAWLANRISVRGQAMPFAFWVNKVLGATGAGVNYQAGMRQDTLVSLNHSGTVRAALNKLAAATGYDYTIEGNTVSWVTFTTKTFDVSFMPGAGQYLMGGQGGGNNANTQLGGAGNVTGQTLGNQFSNMQGNLSVWADLENTIKTMLSKEGQVMVSQATTTITVRDRPQNVRLIADYLASMNKDLARQVALQVEVLQITLNKAFTYGINWNLVAHNLYLNGGVTGGASTDPAEHFTATALGGDLTALGAISPTGLGFGIINGNPRFLINALQQQGKLSVVTQPRVVTLNNQVAQLAITTQKTYLASSTTTNTMNAGTQVSLTPGMVRTGFTLYVLPKIINRDVFLQLTSELSSLDSLITFSASSNAAGGSTTQIQEPTVSSKSFNQRVMVPSGATLVMSGFRQVTNENNKSSMFGIAPLGSRGAQENNIETIVLITPVVVGSG